MEARRSGRLNTGIVPGLVSVLLALCITASNFSVRAESPSFKIYTTQEGLAHDRINNIVRDSRGFLSFCTSEVLSRFDGARFTNFPTDQGCGSIERRYRPRATIGNCAHDRVIISTTQTGGGDRHRNAYLNIANQESSNSNGR